MTNVKYALIIRDAASQQLAVIGTGKEPRVFGNYGQPQVPLKFHRFCLSAFALYPVASVIQTVVWRPGTQLDQAPLVLTAKRTDQPDQPAYSFAEVGA